MLLLRERERRAAAKELMLFVLVTEDLISGLSRLRLTICNITPPRLSFCCHDIIISANNFHADPCGWDDWMAHGNARHDE